MLEPFFVRTVVKKEKVLKRVDPMQVAGLSTEKNYTKIILIDDTAYIVRMSLANALKHFPPDMSPPGSTSLSRNLVRDFF
ncbi:MAG TPA: hypothetical protein VII28_14155 [Puia sp.]